MVYLENKNADPSFLHDVQVKVEELFADYNEAKANFSEEQNKLTQMYHLNEKVFIQFPYNRKKKIVLIL